MVRDTDEEGRSSRIILEKVLNSVNLIDTANLWHIQKGTLGFSSSNSCEIHRADGFGRVDETRYVRVKINIPSKHNRPYVDYLYKIEIGELGTSREVLLFSYSNWVGAFLQSIRYTRAYPLTKTEEDEVLYYNNHEFRQDINRKQLYIKAMFALNLPITTRTTRILPAGDTRLSQEQIADLVGRASLWRKKDFANNLPDGTYLGGLIGQPGLIIRLCPDTKGIECKVVLKGPSRSDEDIFVTEGTFDTRFSDCIGKETFDSQSLYTAKIEKRIKEVDELFAFEKLVETWHLQIEDEKQTEERKNN